MKDLEHKLLEMRDYLAIYLTRALIQPSEN